VFADNLCFIFYITLCNVITVSICEAIFLKERTKEKLFEGSPL